MSPNKAEQQAKYRLMFTIDFDWEIPIVEEEDAHMKIHELDLNEENIDVYNDTLMKRCKIFEHTIYKMEKGKHISTFQNKN